MALTYSTMPPLGAPAHPFRLPGTDGNFYSLDTFAAKKILVVVFMCNHCPYVLAVLQRLIDLQNDYEKNSVQLAGINPNDASRYPDDSPENMKQLSVEKKISFPYLFDASQEIAKAYDAVCTPDIFVYGPKRTLLYRGRIDDNWKEPEKVQQHDLRRAIDQILAGQPVFAEQTPSMGCSIKWKPA
jgi:peroxiredoxin